MSQALRDHLQEVAELSAACDALRVAWDAYFEDDAALYPDAVLDRVRDLLDVEAKHRSAAPVE